MAQQNSYKPFQSHSSIQKCLHVWLRTYQTLIEMSIIDSNDFYDYPTHLLFSHAFRQHIRIPNISIFVRRKLIKIQIKCRQSKTFGINNIVQVMRLASIAGVWNISFTFLYVHIGFFFFHFFKCSLHLIINFCCILGKLFLWR